MLELSCSAINSVRAGKILDDNDVLTGRTKELQGRKVSLSQLRQEPSVTVEHGLISVSGLNLIWFLCGGIGIDLML